MNNRFLLHKDKIHATRIFLAICKIDYKFKEYTYGADVEETKIGMNSDFDFYHIRFNCSPITYELERFANLRDALTYYSYQND